MAPFNIPQLPVELVEAVFSHIWSSPLSEEHRIILITSSMLVNKAWMAMSFRMSLKHVYIPNSSYLDTYLATLSGVSPFLEKRTRRLPGLLCRSISVTVNHSPTGAFGEPTPLMEKVLSNLLYFLRILDTTPHLRTLLIDYVHASFDDVFDFLSYNPLPTTLTHLELRYASPQRVSIDLRHLRRQAPVTFILPGIRHLTISGGNEALIVSLVIMCPGLETLQLDGDEPLFEGAPTFLLGGKLPGKPSDACLSIARSYGSESDEWRGVRTFFQDGISTFCRV